MALLHQLGKETGRHALRAQLSGISFIPLFNARRLHQRIGALAHRGSVVFDLRKLPSADLPRQFQRIGDGRGAAQKYRSGAVIFQNAGKAPDQVGHMGAENAAAGVKLVDHHELQVGKNKIKPVAAVIGQKGSAQHLGVGQQDVRLPAQARPLIDGGVPVVDARTDPVGPEMIQDRAHRPHLVRGKGFGRIKENGPCLGLFKDPADHRQQKAERLAAGRRGGDHQVFPLHGLLVHLRLMGIEPVDPHLLKTLGKLPGEPVREGHKVRLFGRKRPAVDKTVSYIHLILLPRGLRSSGRSFR